MQDFGNNKEVLGRAQDLNTMIFNEIVVCNKSYKPIVLTDHDIEMLISFYGDFISALCTTLNIPKDKVGGLKKSAMDELRAECFPSN